MELKRGEKERMTGRERSEESLRGRWREEEESYGLQNNGGGRWAWEWAFNRI